MAAPTRSPSPERSRVTTDAEALSAAPCLVFGGSAAASLSTRRPTWLGFAWTALGLGRADLSQPEFLSGIRTPILIGRAGRKVVVSPMAQRRAARLLPNCTLIELPEFEHDPFLERDAIRDYWLSCLDRFIAEHLAPTAH